MADNTLQNGSALIAANEIIQAGTAVLAQLVWPVLHFPENWIGTGTAMLLLGTAPVEILPAPGAGTALYVTDLLVTNAGTAGALVTLAGSVTPCWQSYAASGGAGWRDSFVTPINLADNVALNGYLNAAGTVYVSVRAVKVA